MSRNQISRDPGIFSSTSSPSSRIDPDSSIVSTTTVPKQAVSILPPPPITKNKKNHSNKNNNPLTTNEYSATNGQQLSSVFIAMITALLWTSSVLTFACAHAVALCANTSNIITSNSSIHRPEIIFIISIVALSIGSVGSGILSDRIGRTFTVRICLILGTLVTIGAVASHPDDATILLLLVTASGAAAGGSHIAAELFFELLVNKWSMYYQYQQQHSQSSYTGTSSSSSVYVLLCYPGLFFPIGLIQSNIDSNGGWYSLVFATLIISIIAILGSFLLPESTSFIKYKRAQIKAKIKYQQKLMEEEKQRIDKQRLLYELQEEMNNGNYDKYLSSSTDGSTIPTITLANNTSNIPHGFRITDDISGKKQHSHSHHKHGWWWRSCCTHHQYRLINSSTNKNSAATSDGSALNSGLCNRSVLLLVSLWFLFTITYYLSSLTLFVVPMDTSENTKNTVCAISSWRSTSLVPSSTNGTSTTTDRKLDYGTLTNGAFRINTNSSTDSSSYCTENTSSDILQVFNTGIHLIIAEFFALMVIACIMNTELLGRKQTVSSTFALSAATMVFAAATNASLGCEGSITRIAVEFLLHLSLAACAQALFVYTLEVTASNIRSTINGIVIAVFRIGALLTLANGITSFSSSSSSVPQLQWSVYALNYEQSLFGFKPDTSSYNTAMAAVLATCSQICFACAALSSCLPVEPRRFPRNKFFGSLHRESLHNLTFRQRLCSRLFWIQLLTSFVYSIFRTGSLTSRNNVSYQAVQSNEDNEEKEEEDNISLSRSATKEVEDVQREEDLKSLQKEGLELIQILGHGPRSNVMNTEDQIPTIDMNDDDNDDDDDDDDDEIQGIGGGIYITDDENENDSSSSDEDSSVTKPLSLPPKQRSSYFARVFRSEPRSVSVDVPLTIPGSQSSTNTTGNTRNHRTRTESLETMVNGISSSSLASLPTLQQRIEDIAEQHNKEDAVRLANLLDRYALILSSNNSPQEQRSIALDITHLNMEGMNEEYLHQEAARLRFLVRVWKQNE